MNYRHAYHAGNFADVLKHAVLALCIEHLNLKEAPFRLIDVHAGVGRYDLAGLEAGKTLEWIDGIGRLLGMDAPPLPAAIEELLRPYLGVVRGLNPDGLLSTYPGSPTIARRLMRRQDALVVNELHAEDQTSLAALFARDRQTKVLALDAFVAIKSLLPPKERRGLLLIDPPFEERDEFEKLAAALVEARQRFETGMTILWYPIKDRRAVEAFIAAAASGPGSGKTLRAELLIRAPTDDAKFNGCGLFIDNPPWTLKAALARLGPFLAERLSQGAGARFDLS
ncbi:MAG: 23S rRNA (adenine(2030)-N(6))-methyltransferase RlmJ [Parvularculaceae bacterium]